MIVTTALCHPNDFAGIDGLDVVRVALPDVSTQDETPT
jgi:hypothetical protein